MDVNLKVDYNPQFEIESVKFRFYSETEVKALSVKEVTNVETFDNLGHCNIGGLYDPALGPTENSDLCHTCGLSTNNCPGHMGHIKLALPLFNTIVFPTLFQLIKATCFHCHRLNIEATTAKLFLAQCSLLNEGLVAEAADMQGLFAELEKGLEKQGKALEIESFIEKAFHGSVKSHVIVKNVEAVKQEIFKSFMKTHVKYKSHCFHCSAHMQKLRTEYNSKIFVVGDKTAGIKKNAKSCNIVSDEEDDDDQPQMKKQKVQVTNDKGANTGEVTLLTPFKIKEHLHNVWKLESELLEQIYPSLKASELEHPTDMFFVDVIPVPATKFRPIALMRGKKFEHPQTSNLLRVLKCNHIVREILWELEKSSATTDVTEKAKYSKDVNQILGKTLVDKLSNALARLQAYSNAVVDSDLDKLSEDVNPGIKQVIEKKSGIFRKNMMGKRVNYAARSVISPDPNINTNEIGIPEVFAKVLSYPQPVTPWNVHELRQAVINGPDIYPGATHVMGEDGYIMRLDHRYPEKRESLAKELLTPTTLTETNPNGVKKVMRHLKNGDVLLINRQPTLHRPSIQAHKARVLKGEKTLRLHYANCKAYNADFDGDEMNAHFPQNEIARSEAYHLASTDFQYLVPKDGTPLAGLIQDHMVSGVSLTVRGRFFNKDDYCRLVYGALVDKNGPMILLPPSIIKPMKLWSGKQVLSSVVLNVIPDGKPALSLDGRAKVPEKMNYARGDTLELGSAESWIKDQKSFSSCEILKYMMESNNVIIRQGELLCGVLDKGHYGPSNYGLIHCCYELYGGRVAGLMLTCFGRLFMNFLQWRGFSLGVEDILVTRQGDKKRSRIIKKSPGCGQFAARKALELENTCSNQELLGALKSAQFSVEERHMRELDMNMRNRTNEIQNDIVNACMPNGLEKLFPDNNLQLMVQSGAKGSMVNCMQISCLLGQIELEGRRPPLMLSGKSLPSFLSYDVTPRAGGFVTGRFLTGIRQQEYFFHCMAGREGLVDTAVKTSRSGYLQRCLIKHLEGIKVNYDLTVRDCDSSVIQFKYGEDSLDITKTGFLTPKQFPFLETNQHILETKQQNVVYNEREAKAAGKLEKKIQKWKKKHGGVDRKMRSGGFVQFCQDVGQHVNLTEVSEFSLGRSQKDTHLCSLWKDLSVKQKKKYEKKCAGCPDPVLSRFLPYIPNVVPEKLGDVINNYAKTSTNKGSSEKQFCKFLNSKLLQSLIEPGEAVGLLCSQSIGEPSTQMTLNTFHFAGRGEMNVTLGIPRLREILLVGSKNIKTPALDVPVVGGDDVRDKVKKLQRKLTKVNLNEVIKDIQVCEWLSIKGKIRVQRRRVFRIRFNFLSRECYRERFIVMPNKILQFVEKTYIKKMVQLIRAKINAQHKLLSSGTQKRSRYSGETESSRDKLNVDDDDEDEAMDADDGDDTATNQKRKKMEEHEYDDEDEDSRDSTDKASLDEEDDVDMDEEFLETEDIDEELIAEYEERDRDKDNPEARINFVLQSAPEVDNYRYDLKKKLWCEVTVSFALLDSKIDLLALIEADIKKHVVHEVPGISRCYLGEQDGPHGYKELHLKTEGINMHELYKNVELLDINRLYCNSIHDVAVTYGIEAASKVIIKEVQSVFASYGINVDYRHLSLLADYMTFEGSYKPFNRVAMESNPSPLQKMSFEQTMKFLVESSVKCRTDELKSPSAQIVLGKNVTCGTGCIDILTPLIF